MNLFDFPRVVGRVHLRKAVSEGTVKDVTSLSAEDRTLAKEMLQCFAIFCTCSALSWFHFTWLLEMKSQRQMTR